MRTKKKIRKKRTMFGEKKKSHIDIVLVLYGEKNPLGERAEKVRGFSKRETGKNIKRGGEGT